MDLSRLNPYSPASKAAPAGTYINRALRGARTSADQLAAAGWTATIENGANVGSRITATRVLAVGVLAAGARKTTGDQYVLFTSPDGTQQEMATVPARLEKSIRQWVLLYAKKRAQAAPTGTGRHRG
ncbi:hypothetical protein [Streptacidiphilus albus]|jgi:hypothetical protein|uniref:hypothetical protein n=1 Tax=Streptacidiphilus albus TaxID=105425 RepID=UPI00054B5856|nr:hypothetical protein [Streptacidiphilus albus]